MVNPPRTDMRTVTQHNRLTPLTTIRGCTARRAGGSTARRSISATTAIPAIGMGVTGTVADSGTAMAGGIGPAAVTAGPGPRAGPTPGTVRGAGSRATAGAAAPVIAAAA